MGLRLLSICGKLWMRNQDRGRRSLWKGNWDMDSKKRILLADGDDVFRDLLRETLLKEPDFEVVGETGDGEEAV